jgi:CDP-Glycerol:Poly(glycerophosphate) glycerophosphotransferase
MTAPDGTQRLLDFDPNWCLFWGHAVAGFQMEIWIPYIRRSRYRFAIMSGVDGFSDAVRESVATLPNCIIIEPYEEVRATLRKVSGLRGFLYIGTREENFRLVNRFAGKLHIWLGHGESDKIYNAFRTASLYDSMFVARYGVTKRYPRAIRRWVAQGACAIGTPIVEGLVKDPWARPRPIRTILYAPTWEGASLKADYTSLSEVGPVLLDAMPRLAERGISVIMRPHPATGRRRPELIPIHDALFSAGARRGGAKTSDFAEADVIISDISGVTAEFLFTEKPVILPAFGRLAAIGKDDARLAQEYPWVYRWHPEEEELIERLEALQESDPLRAKRAASARDMFHGHRSIEEAVVSFDIALASVRWRKTRVPVRWVYETRRFLARLRPVRRTPGRPAQAGREDSDRR